MADGKGSVILGTIVMVVLSLLLVWLPGIGSLIAGIVGGKIAGSVGKALLAAILPGIVLAAALGFIGTALTGLPVVGVVFGAGALVLVLVQIGPLLLGAFIGGLIA